MARWDITETNNYEKKNYFIVSFDDFRYCNILKFL